jgi:hypothetical protein
MINTDPTQGKNVISICNYDKYQDPKNTANTAPNTRLTQQQHTPNTQKEQGNKVTTSTYVEDTAREAVKAWNEFASESGWSEVQKLSKPRLSAIKARLKDCGGIDGWRDALRKAAASSFLTGQTSKPFFASFDWITKPANFTKLMEGNYDDRVNQNNQSVDRGAGGAHDSLMAGFAAFANSDPDASGGDCRGSGSPKDPSDSTVDSRQGGYPSEPILRVINTY